MIDYDPGTLGVLFVFRLYGSVFPKGMVWSVPNAIIAVLLHTFSYGLVNLDGVDMIWAGYTSVLGFLVVFRNQQAYSRFWESATLIQQTRGEWMNAVSSLFAFCSMAESKKDTVETFQHLIVRLMSMLYCQALQQICDLTDDSLEIIDVSGLDAEHLVFLQGVGDRCEVLLQWLQRAIVDAHVDGIICAPPPILSRAFQELSRGIVNLNNVRKIKEVPFPFPYAQMITVMLMVHWAITPLMAAHFVENRWCAGAICFLVTQSFWSLLYIAREIDHPFGEDPNDFNIMEMMHSMNSSLITLLQPLAQTPPHIIKEDLKLEMSRSDLHIAGASSQKGMGMKRQPSNQVNQVRQMSEILEPMRGSVVNTRLTQGRQGLGSASLSYDFTNCTAGCHTSDSLDTMMAKDIMHQMTPEESLQRASMASIPVPSFESVPGNIKERIGGEGAASRHSTRSSRRGSTSSEARGYLPATVGRQSRGGTMGMGMSSSVGPGSPRMRQGNSTSSASALKPTMQLEHALSELATKGSPRDSPRTSPRASPRGLPRASPQVSPQGSPRLRGRDPAPAQGQHTHGAGADPAAGVDLVPCQQQAPQGDAGAGHTQSSVGNIAAASGGGDARQAESSRLPFVKDVSAIATRDTVCPL